MSWLNPENSTSEESRRRAGGRRSRLEMTCDVLYVISQGVEKPTRIMQISNVTWKDLLVYLGALLRNQLITRETNGSRVGYRLTEKGEKALDLYVKLKEMSSGLDLGPAVPKPVDHAMQDHSSMDEVTAELLARRLRVEGFTIEGNRVLGRSGETHVFDVVARDRDNSRKAYVIRETVTEEQVLGLFVSQLDTDLGIHINYMNEPSEATRKLAQNYSIVLEPWKR